MRRALAILLLVLTAACHEANNPTPDPDPADESDYALENGPVTCDGCPTARLLALGPDVQGFLEASLIARTPDHRPARAAYELRRLTVQAGRGLEVTARFLDTLPAGEYDLILGGLDTVPDALVPRALVVTRPFQPLTPIDPAPGDPGTLRVTVTSSGVEPDRGFTLVDVQCTGIGCGPVVLSAGVPRDLVLGSGDYLFRLADIAPTCSVNGSNPVAVRVVAGTVTTLNFDVRCTERAWIRVAARTTGFDLPTSYGIACISGNCNLSTSTLPAQGTIVLLTAAAPLSLELREVPANCTPEGGFQRSVTAVPGDTVDVTFDVTCRRLPTVRVSTRTTGGGADGTYTVVEGADCSYYYSSCRYFWLVEPDTLSIRVAEGQTTLRLEGLAANCRVTSPNPVTLDVLPESDIDVVFEVNCLPSGRVSVTTRTTGTNVDGSYRLLDESSCDWYYQCDSYVLVEPAAVEFDVSANSVRVLLYDIADNCVVQGANPVTLAVQPGEVTVHQYEVACQ